MGHSNIIDLLPIYQDSIARLVDQCTGIDRGRHGFESIAALEFLFQAKKMQLLKLHTARMISFHKFC